MHFRLEIIIKKTSLYKHARTICCTTERTSLARLKFHVFGAKQKTFHSRNENAFFDVAVGVGREYQVLSA
jgi:hypothetical protein